MLLRSFESEHQHLRLSHEEEGGLRLELDDARQFVERQEHRYHESLAVVPLLFAEPRRVLILGGGDGLAAARLVKFDGIEEIVVCDHDPAVTELACEEPELIRLNEGALRDPRVTVIHQDAYEYLRAAGPTFDLLIADFPDPYTAEFSRLYSVEFYSMARRCLDPQGLLITQLPGMPESAAIGLNTLRQVFPYAYFFKTRVYGFNECAFAIGSNHPLPSPRPVPAWTRYLNDEVARSLFVRPKDEPYESTLVNTEENQILARKTLIAAMKPIIGAPYHYDPSRFVVFLDGDIEFREQYVSEFLEYLVQDEHPIVYIEEKLEPRWRDRVTSLGFEPRSRFVKVGWQLGDETRTELERTWARFDDGSRSELEIHHCAPVDREEVRALMDAYLAEYTDLFFDASPQVDVMAQPGLFAISRNPEGEACGLMKLMLSDGGVEMESIYDRGSRRQLNLSFDLLLRYLHDEEPGREFVTFTHERAARRCLEVGARRLGTYGVYEIPPRTD